MPSLICFDKVSRSYRVATKESFGVKDVTFDIANGSIVSFIGPSGCGKTTLLKMIAGILAPSAGTILVQNEDPQLASKKSLLGYVPQNTSLLPHRTVSENISLSLEITKKKDREALGKVVELVNLKNCLHYFPHQLSGGMKQKVSLARALVHSPKILLMDEPFSSLDEITREKLDERLLDVYYVLRPTVVFVTHSIEEAVFLSQKIYIMSQAPGTVVDVLNVNLPEKRDLGLKNTQEFFEEVVRLRKKMEVYV